MSGKFYIGSAVDINERWARHIRDLNSGCHPSHHFINAWRKYGQETFVFSIIEKCEESTLLIREQYYLDLHWDSGLLYNTCKTAGRPPKFSELSPDAQNEMRKKVSEASKKSPKSKEWIANQGSLTKAWEALKNMTPEQKDEYKRKISEINIGRKHTEQSKAKISSTQKG